MAQKSIVQRITEFFTTANTAVTDRIRIVMSRFLPLQRTPVNDWSRPDYDYWRRAYRAQVRGLELSGLLIKPLVSKTAGWVLGRPPQFKIENKTAAEEFSAWLADHHSEVLKAYKESVKLGDGFLVVNPDMSLAIIPPQHVTPIISDTDYSQQLGWRVAQTFTHPDYTGRKMTIIDEYTAVSRVRIVDVDGRESGRQEFPNLIGRVPVIHIGNNVEAGETFGRPEAEALVNVLQRYGVIIEAAAEGNELQGRPTPVLNFETKDDLDTFWNLYGETERQTLPDGSTETSKTLSVDLQRLLTVSGATFSYQSPGSFIGDAVRLLEIMFYLILEHTELPEFIFGNAVSSSKASTETQMPVFVRFIEMKQGEAARWLKELAEVVLSLMSLTSPGVAVESPMVQWEQLTTDDGQLTLQALQWALTEGLIDDRTALQLAPLDIEDIDAVLEQARVEKEEREARFAQNQLPPAAVANDLEEEINKLELEA